MRKGAEMREENELVQANDGEEQAGQKEKRKKEMEA